MKYHKSMAPVVDLALRGGFHVDKTGRGHLRFSRAGYPPVFASAYPKDRRAVKNAVCRLRRLIDYGPPEDGSTRL